jgi:hypothetical protein
MMLTLRLGGKDFFPLRRLGKISANMTLHDLMESQSLVFAQDSLGCREREIIKALFLIRALVTAAPFESETDRAVNVLVAEEQRLDQSLSYSLEASGGRNRISHVTRG